MLALSRMLQLWGSTPNLTVYCLPDRSIPAASAGCLAIISSVIGRL